MKTFTIKISLLLFLLFLNTSLSAACSLIDSTTNDAADSAPGTIIPALHNKSSSITTCISGTSPNREKDYFYFTAGVKGTLDMSSFTTNNGDYRFQVGSSENGNEYYGQTKSKTHTLSQITLLAGESVYIYVVDDDDDDDDNDVKYQIDFSFAATSGLSLTTPTPDTEGNSGQKTFTTTVNSYPVSLSTVTVDYSTSDGTATVLDGDYNATSGTLTFLPGETSKTITVLVNGDTTIENDEIFYINLSNPVGSTISTAQTTFTITDDDDNSDYTRNNDRVFTLYRQNNIVGDMQIIGNSVKLDSGGVCAPASTNNNNLNVVYADLDSDTNTFNSTSADLVLPQGVSGADIQYALLYWQGRTNNSNGDVKNGRTVKVKAYGQTNYQVLNSINSKFNWLGSDYQGVADVTDIIKTSVDDVNSTILDATGYNKPLWVADVYAPKTSNGFGAWSLVIVYKDNASALRNISSYDGYLGIHNTTKTSVLSGFLTPTSGAVDSKFLIFAGEGDISLNDSVTMTDNNGVDQSLGSNVFKSAEDIAGVNVTNRNPSCSNTIGVDIRTFNVGTVGTGALSIIGNRQTTTTIKLTGSGDQFFPGVFAFSTELYQPDVCYDEALTFNDLNVSATNTPNVGDTVDYEVSITNRNFEVAKKVSIQQIFAPGDGLEYVPESMNIAPIPGITYPTTNRTDTIGDDTAEFNVDSNTTQYLVGAGANNLIGGDIALGDVTKFKYQAKINEVSVSENVYLVSYRNSLLNIDFVGIPIRKCTDFSNSFSAYAPAGNFNVVNSNFAGSTDPLNNADPLNALWTQVVNKPFSVKVLALDTDLTSLLNITDDINISIIKTPNYSLCSDDTCRESMCASAVPLSNMQTVHFANQSSANISVTYSKAIKDASFKMHLTPSNGIPTYLCSRDSFSIRPDKFVLAFPAGEDTELLTSAKEYNLTLSAINYATNTLSSDYNIITANNVLDLNKTIYKPDLTDGTASLNGVLSFHPLSPFTIIDGYTANATLSFTDVGKVNIKIIDKKWAEVDTYNSDTAEDCSPTGAYVCGDINATFIPDHFALSAVTLNNSNGGNFTYLSNDLNVSAHLSLTLTAQNSLNGTTQNFKQASWENPVNINLTVPTVATLVPNKDDINETVNLNFLNGALTIPLNEANNTKKIMFNYPRTINNAKNPFRVLGANVDLNASTSYTSTSGNTKVISGVSVADANATFIYGRAHAARQRFDQPTGTANIYYEAFCFGTDNVAVACTKSLLPNGTNATNSDDIRWFINENHTATQGNAGTVVEKDAIGKVTVAGSSTGIHPDNSTLMTYDATQGYPYRTTMIHNASPWLLYNQDNAGANTNQFPVEFDIATTGWSGTHETNTTTADPASPKTNRTSMW